MFTSSNVLRPTATAAGERGGDECRANTTQRQRRLQTMDGGDAAEGDDRGRQYSGAGGPWMPSLVNVTLQCGPGSTVVLRDWGLYGGFIAVAGPLTWGTVSGVVAACVSNDSDGSVTVTDVRLSTTNRSAVTVVAGGNHSAATVLGLAATTCRSPPDRSKTVLIWQNSTSTINGSAVKAAAIGSTSATGAAVGLALAGMAPWSAIVTAATLSMCGMDWRRRKLQ
jgi:hypothetical protein